ncbi:MAG: hypothetical protein CM1200mP41_34560 [Gammaproteobacteria bacterium]|nr:MAG: hypothetical protein CM1200mP41_34560 [Gammaproteobacteria bacterium]
MFAAEMPLSIRRLRDLFGGADDQLRSDLDTVLALLTDEYQGRGIELVQVAEGYRFQTVSNSTMVAGECRDTLSALFQGAA